MDLRDIIEMITLETAAEGLIFLFFLGLFYRMFIGGGMEPLIHLFGTAFCGGG